MFIRTGDRFLDCPGDQAEAITISGTSRVGLSTPRRNLRSLAGSSVANIAFKFDAMVISATAGPISPFTITG